jgi:hypothetical protein
VGLLTSFLVTHAKAIEMEDLEGRITELDQLPVPIPTSFLFALICSPHFQYWIVGA